MTVEILFAKMLTAFPGMADDGKIFFDHIEVEEGHEITPPYTVLTEIQKDPFFADDTVYYLTIQHTVELYTATYDAVLIDKFERFFNRNNVPFSTSVEWQDDLEMYDVTFNVELDPSEVDES